MSLGANAMLGYMYNSGTLAGATPVVVTMVNAPLPATIFLKSVLSVGRKIEFSDDGGLNYEEVTYSDNTVTVKRALAISGVTHLRFTGAAGDTWGIC